MCTACLSQAVFAWFSWRVLVPVPVRVENLLPEGSHICNVSRLFLFSVILLPGGRWAD